MKYRLGDITVKYWNDWDNVPRMPEVIVPKIAAALAVSTTVATVIYYVGMTAITSWAVAALTPKPDFGNLTSAGILVNNRDGVAPAQFVYGNVRKGGVVTYVESTGEKNKYLHQIIVLAAHELNSIGDIYIQDSVYSIDANGFVDHDDWKDEDGNSKIRIYAHRGNQTSVTTGFANVPSKNLSNTLLAETELTGDDALTTDFVGKGLAYLYVRFEYDQNVFSNGLPLITAKVEGKKVYDPRTDTTAYSSNAALCIRDFITSSYGLNDSSIDDVSFSAAANECDEQISLVGGGTENRYEINGIVNADRAIGDVLGDMVTACAGTLFWGSGYWKLKVGAYSAPVKTLTPYDLRSPISLETRITMRDNFNAVQGTFNDASQDYITVDYPPIKSSVFKQEDGDEEVFLDLQLPYTTSASAAQRLAKMTLFRGREQMTITADFGLSAFDVEVGDIVAFSNARYGWSQKEFEVISWKFAPNGDGGDLRVTMTLRETSEAAFSWTAEESEIIANNTNLTDSRAGLNVSNVTVSDKGNIQKDGTFIGQALVQWTHATNQFLNHYEIEWKDVDELAYQRTQIPFEQNDVIIGPLETGTQYSVRVRGVSVTGVQGSWVAPLLYTHGGDTTAPSPVTNLTAAGGPKIVTLDWTPPTTDSDSSVLYDLKGYNIYRNTTTTKPADPAAFSGSDKFVDGGLLASSTYYYWVSAVDYSGNESTAVATTAVTTDGPTQDTRIYTGIIYYQTLQATAPTTPTATGFNETTQGFEGLTSGWSTTQPFVDATSTTVKEWSSKYKVEYDIANNETITFTTPDGAFQITDDIESDNYVAGNSGWRIERDTGFAEFGSAAIRDTLSAGQIPTLAQSKIADLTTDLSNLSSAVSTAQSTADSKIKTFNQSTTPTATSVGDLWYNTSNDYYYRWSGTSWVQTSIQADSVVSTWVYTNTLVATQITAGTISVNRLPGLTFIDVNNGSNAGFAGNSTVGNAPAGVPTINGTDYWWNEQATKSCTSGSRLVATITVTFFNSDNNESAHLYDPHFVLFSGSQVVYARLSQYFGGDLIFAPQETVTLSATVALENLTASGTAYARLYWGYHSSATRVGTYSHCVTLAEYTR